MQEPYLTWKRLNTIFWRHLFHISLRGFLFFYMHNNMTKTRLTWARTERDEKPWGSSKQALGTRVVSKAESPDRWLQKLKAFYSPLIATHDRCSAEGTACRSGRNWNINKREQSTVSIMWHALPAIHPCSVARYVPMLGGSNPSSSPVWSLHVVNMLVWVFCGIPASCHHPKTCMFS